MRAAVLAGATVLALLASVAPAAAGDAARFDQPRRGFSPAGTELRDSSPRAAGLDPAPVREALAAVERGTREGGADASGTSRPLFSGAVTVMATGGEVVAREATGWALRYADGQGTELPRDQWEPVTEDTVFDMASVSKLFTSVVVMQQVEAGRVDLDEPVATYLPEFAAGGKEGVTVRHLLTHTGGLPAWLPLWSAYPDPGSRLRAALEATPVGAPGEQYLYSDLGLIALGALVERVSGDPLDALVAEGVTGPLGMVDTGYNPTGDVRDRAAATEHQTTPPRGMVRGEVHDENAWALGGVSGHAGVFSTARDMSVLAQAMLDGGTYAGERILSRSSVEQMLADENREFPGDAHGLGFELDQRWYMGALSGPRTAGHTGYTGTSLVLDYQSGSFAVLLTNRVHPSRSWGSVNAVRRAVADGLARALRVPPREGRTAWATPTTDATTSTLTAAVEVPARGGRLAFDLFVDTEATDVLALETSADGGATWSPLPFDVRDRGVVTRTDGTVAGAGHRTWWQASTRLPAGDLLLRWRYTTDAGEQGRGVLVDGVVARSGGQVLLDGERRPGAFTGVGWRTVRG
ncbi:serine hydrolase domain-containing protein [Vallicoccus soli]|uniref:Class A beta-lactamase-related serine hydrolase n=1 Tax=Vallicoccus soli TaxID=2339232 RepID=A0A3A3ZMP6_9ACTN|nr:serine hydrolase domain-containing protein [Vallicoccus soli]RJK97961.1 class A beta-lactamase-related serine hydrolase [Vallicoccus soli]